MATAAFTTVVDRAIGDPLTEAIWDDQLKDNLNQLAGAHRNLLTNGGFEVWQRGSGPFTANGYTADRWEMAEQGSTCQVDRESSTVDASLYSLKFVASALVGSPSIFQEIEDFRQLRGRTVSFSCRVHQSVASLVSAGIRDNAGPSPGTSSATTGAWVTLTATRTIDAAATEVIAYLEFDGAGTLYIDNAMLVIGPAPAPYRPLHPQEDLARCQRYYEVLGGVADTIYFDNYAAAGVPAGGTLFFKVPKGGTPTVTKNGTWGVTNCAQPTVGGASVGSCYIQALVSALGRYAFQTNSADDTVTVEWNP